MSSSLWCRLGRLLACSGSSPDTRPSLQSSGGAQPPSDPQSFDAADRKPTKEESLEGIEVAQIPPSCLPPHAPTEAAPLPLSMQPAPAVALPTQQETAVWLEGAQSPGEGTTSSTAVPMPAVVATVGVSMPQPSPPPTLTPLITPSCPLPPLPLPQLHLSLPGLPQRHHERNDGGNSSEDETDDDGASSRSSSSSGDEEVGVGFHVSLVNVKHATDEPPAAAASDGASILDQSCRLAPRGQLRQLLSSLAEEPATTAMTAAESHQPSGSVIPPPEISISAEQHEQNPTATSPSVMSAEELIRSARCASDAVSASLSVGGRRGYTSLVALSKFSSYLAIQIGCNRSHQSVPVLSPHISHPHSCAEP